MGLFTNLVLLTSNVDAELTCKNYLKRVQKEVISTYKNQDFPHYSVNRNISNYSNFGFNFINDSNKKLAQSQYNRENWIVKYKYGEPFLFSLIVELNEVITIQYHYPPHKFKDETIIQMANEFESILVGVLNNDSTSIQQIIH